MSKPGGLLHSIPEGKDMEGRNCIRFEMENYDHDAPRFQESEEEMSSFTKEFNDVTAGTPCYEVSWSA